MRPVQKVAAVFGAASLLLCALMALAQTSLTPQPFQWGVLADSGTTILLDAGALQYSFCLSNTPGTNAIVCYVQDAGAANVAAGGVGLYGTDYCGPDAGGQAGTAHATQLGSWLSFSGGPGAVAWDPVVSAMQYYLLVVDAGSGVDPAGFLSCTITTQRTQ